MSIVAISETMGSLGNEIGRRLAESLGWGFADREIIAKAAERFGADLAEVRHNAEEKPSLWERFTDSHRRFKAFVEASMFDMAATDNVVLAGLASTLVLRDVRYALRVRTNAPEHDRARRIEQQQGLTAAAALDVVRHTDRERAARVKFLYHVDVDDPLLVRPRPQHRADHRRGGRASPPGDAPRGATPVDRGLESRARRPERGRPGPRDLHGRPHALPAATLRVLERRSRVRSRAAWSCRRRAAGRRASWSGSPVSAAC